mmetsp:Transcript_9454/g.9783  ORF Transcript_9454/g.9783 Transcript_9454/m.9783 type:complete len:355 (+) Transcript_9454:651-1715(+)
MIFDWIKEVMRKSIINNRPFGSMQYKNSEDSPVKINSTLPIKSFDGVSFRYDARPTSNPILIKEGTADEGIVLFFAGTPFLNNQDLQISKDIKFMKDKSYSDFFVSMGKYQLAIHQIAIDKTFNLILFYDTSKKDTADDSTDREDKEEEEEKEQDFNIISQMNLSIDDIIEFFPDLAKKYDRSLLIEVTVKVEDFYPGLSYTERNAVRSKITLTIPKEKKKNYDILNIDINFVLIIDNIFLQLQSNTDTSRRNRFDLILKVMCEKNYISDISIEVKEKRSLGIVYEQFLRKWLIESVNSVLCERRKNYFSEGTDSKAILSAASNIRYRKGVYIITYNEEKYEDKEGDRKKNADL